jgi:hypothetical protein
MDQGRTADACEKFAESLTLERRGGVLLNLAVCREQQGRYATALSLFHEARERASKDGRADRVALAEEHLAMVRKRVSWLRVQVPASADAIALEVRCDQDLLPRESWGALRAVDPGPHTISAVAPGRPRFEAVVVVGPEGDSRTVEISRSVAVAEIPAPSALATSAREAAAPRLVPSRPRPVHAWSTPVGAAITGVGVAVAITGAAFGVKAIFDIRDSDASCPHDGCTTAAAFRDNQDAHTAAHVADIAVPTGLAVASAGLFLLLRRARPAADLRVASRIIHVVPTAAGHAASLVASVQW